MLSARVPVCVRFYLLKVGLLSTLLGLRLVASVQFIEEPEDTTKIFQYGSNNRDKLFLDCYVSYSSLNSQRTVSWYKNGEIISTGNSFLNGVTNRLVDERYRIYSYGTAGRFAILVDPISANWAQFDSGSYQCAVTWLSGVAIDGGRSNTAEVNVYLTPTFSYPMCKIRIAGGQDALADGIKNVRSGDIQILTCLSGPSFPQVMLYWYNGLDLLQRSGSGINSDNSVFVTFDWNPSRNGNSFITFTCSLRHPGLQFDRTCTVSFNIQYVPIVTIDLIDTMVIQENDEILLHCNQDANPQVTEPVWYYDNNVVNSGDRFSLEGMSLRISTFSSRDNGDHTVTCELINVIGTGSDRVTLTVNIPTPSTHGPVPRTASLGSTIPDSPDYNVRTTVAANKSHSTDPFAIPRKTNNTGIIIGSVVGICLLIAVIIILVILICLKTRRKSSESPKSSSDNFDAQRGESGGDVIGVVREDTTSQGYEWTNGAFVSEYSDIAMELGGRAILKIDGNNKTAASDADHESDTVNSADLYSKPKKKPKPPKKQTDDESKTAESETVHHSDTVTSADLYSKPKKKPKPPKKQMDDESKTAESETVHHSDMVTLADLYAKPKKKPKPPYKKQTNQQKTEDEQYANMGLKAKAKSGTQSEEPSVDPDMSPYANMGEKKNRATDSLYDSVNNSTSTDADVPRNYFGRHKQRRGDPEVSKTEKPAFTKNAEGLTYAELDLSSTSVTSRPMKMPEAENTVYADLQM